MAFQILLVFLEVAMNCDAKDRLRLKAPAALLGCLPPRHPTQEFVFHHVHQHTSGEQPPYLPYTGPKPTDGSKRELHQKFVEVLQSGLPAALHYGDATNAPFDFLYLIPYVDSTGLPVTLAFIEDSKHSREDPPRVNVATEAELILAKAEEFVAACNEPSLGLGFPVKLAHCGVVTNGKGGDDCVCPRTFSLQPWTDFLWECDTTD